ncbi:hypothetical protein SDC9_53717 [bioreactor metagenome]|uniref:Lipoprotein n=1 Tax=bioreactor metagenome TaxID=1076179 RepID=A0A644WUY8_9ZZZZ
MKIIVWLFVCLLFVCSCKQSSKSNAAGEAGNCYVKNKMLTSTLKEKISPWKTFVFQRIVKNGKFSLVVTNKISCDRSITCDNSRGLILVKGDTFFFNNTRYHDVYADDEHMPYDSVFQTIAFVDSCNKVLKCFTNEEMMQVAGRYDYSLSDTHGIAGEVYNIEKNGCSFYLIITGTLFSGSIASLYSINGDKLWQYYGYKYGNSTSGNEKEIFDKYGLDIIKEYNNLDNKKCFDVWF